MSNRDRALQAFDAQLLRRALAANAMFSAASGTLFAVAPALVESGLGYTGPSGLVRWVGVALLVFAGLLAFDARRSLPDPRRAMAASLGDFTWVLGTLGLYLGDSTLFSGGGWLAAWAIAACVAVFGSGQLLGIRRLVHVPGRPAGSVQVVEHRVLRGPPKRAWAVISDVGGYAKYAPSLDSSEILAGSGVGMVRRCGDRRGTWTESCSTWQPGEGFGFTVDTSADDYPYPFSELSGRWAMRSADSGEAITADDFERDDVGMEISMELEARMPGGVLGEFAFAMLLTPARVALMGLFDNWQAAIAEGTGGQIADA